MEANATRAFSSEKEKLRGGIEENLLLDKGKKEVLSVKMWLVLGSEGEHCLKQQVGA